MKKRTMTGLVITAAVCLILIFSHIPVVLYSVVGLLCISAVYEIWQAAGFERNRKLLWVAMAAAVVITLIPIPNYAAVCAIVFPAAVLLFGWMMVRQKRIALNRPWKAVATAVLPVLLYRSIPAVRALPQGFLCLGGAILLCSITDIAAYLVGSRFGRRKLIPSVSPNKTVEGALAGVAAAVLCMLALGVLAQYFGGVTVRYGLLAVYAAGASVVGQFGDLSMSVVKRICGIKDFGHIFPGHGGMLDRFDSHLFCIPFTLLFVTFGGSFFC